MSKLIDLYVAVAALERDRLSHVAQNYLSAETFSLANAPLKPAGTPWPGNRRSRTGRSRPCGVRELRDPAEPEWDERRRR
ncbi:hypothetical protein [Nonomuraea sp. NPDC023979]|uniref:hypothetical protein n=1 Tax=Nonomuraea sp. NPDC023979 TaxID=3154796 RepID=UPI0033E35703